MSLGLIQCLFAGTSRALSIRVFTPYVDTMHLLKGQLAKQSRVAKSDCGTVREGYEARCRGMLAEVACDIKEPINALREKYGKKPF